MCVCVLCVYVCVYVSERKRERGGGGGGGRESMTIFGQMWAADMLFIVKIVNKS